MASYKNVQKSRRKKESHFRYTSEQMTSLTSPPHQASRDHRDQDVRSVLSVRPDQEPVIRVAPGQYQPDNNDSEASRASSDVNIQSESLQKLHEIIEAQKAFLKYQEIRDILSRQSQKSLQDSKRAASKSSRSKSGKSVDVIDSDVSVIKSASLNLNSDSDKENSNISSQQQSSKGTR